MSNSWNTGNTEKDSNMDDTAPFFRKWEIIYGIVLGTLALMVVLFYWFSISLK